MPAYLYILVLKVVFAVIKSKKTINVLKIFEYEFLYTAYADDSFSSWKTKNMLRKFSKVSELKPNTSKCEIAGEVWKRFTWHSVACNVLIWKKRV